MSAQRKWVIGVVSVVVILALLACGIFFAWRYFFAGKPPSVEITAPPSNYEVLEGDEVTVEAKASGRSLERIELWVDHELANSATSVSPVDSFRAELAWEAMGLGRHIVQVKAYDSAGGESDPARIIIIVVPTVAEATPTITVGPPFETPTPTTPPTPTPTSAPAATPTPTGTAVPPTATPTETAVPPTPTPTSPPPSCPTVFTASPGTQTQGSPFDLNWNVDNATALHLSGPAVGTQVGVTGPGGSMTVCCPPVGTHTYTLHVSCPAGDFDEQVTVQIASTVTLNTVAGETGQVVQTGGSGPSLYVGDIYTNVGSRGFMSFNISGLAGKTVTEAKLNFPGPDIDGDPFGELSGLWIGKTSYTWPPPYAPPATAMIGTQWSMPAEITITSHVAPEVSGGAPRFQVTLHFNANTNGDGGTDRIWWPPGGHPTLTITYTD